nr:hypothetical protein CFP56_68247 [Quercus suber]
MFGTKSELLARNNNGGGDAKREGAAIGFHPTQPSPTQPKRYKKWRMAIGIGSSNSNIIRLYYLQAACLNDLVLNTV